MTVTHIRNAHVIRTLAQPGTEKNPDGVSASSETFKSINAAKRASRLLQKRPGVVLRVKE